MSAPDALPPAELLDAAMRCCDHWNDSPARRQEMVADITSAPAEHWPGLLAHFLETYP